jgi:multiple sugar transport system permease protein
MYELFTQFNFGRYLLVSFIVSTATVILTLLFSIPGAYAVARLRFKGQHASPARSCSSTWCRPSCW